MKIWKGISTAYGAGRFCGLGRSQLYQKRCRTFVAKVLRLPEDKKVLILPILRKKSQEDLTRKREKVRKKIQVL